jgi:hypothetical protein
MSETTRKFKCRIWNSNSSIISEVVKNMRKMVKGNIKMDLWEIGAKIRINVKRIGIIYDGGL